MTVLTNEYQMASYNHYDTSGINSVSNNFQQSAQMGPQAILDANGLGKGPGVVNSQQTAGVHTGPACLVGRSTDVAYAMPQASSLFGDIAGAIGGLSQDVQHTVAGPKVQAVINPDMVIASLDQAPVPATPVMAQKFQPANGFGA